jgi:hypothetical protein
MEKRIAIKIDEYLDDFKLKIKDKLEGENNISFQVKSDILKFIYDFNSFNLTKDDFAKRKRCKSVVPFYLRCKAKRSNGEQCTRKHKDDSEYCGTHDKNRPHGEIDVENLSPSITLNKVEVWLEEINGIHYYIDKSGNIYKTEDIIKNLENPKIIAKYFIDNSIYKFINL